MNKLEAARRQLGASLALFLDDRDSVSVHTLAGSAREIIEVLCRKAGKPVFVDHIQKTFPSMERKEIYRLANKYRNAFKHLTEGTDDAAVLDGFTDVHNDSLMLVAWRDYGALTGALPIEAQVFDLWYCALYREKVTLDASSAVIDEFFPNLAELPRAIAKARLRDIIAESRRDKGVMTDTRTEKLPLLMGSIDKAASH